jgi:hypothetical protein
VTVLVAAELFSVVEELPTAVPHGSALVERLVDVEHPDPARDLAGVLLLARIHHLEESSTLCPIRFSASGVVRPAASPP